MTACHHDRDSDRITKKIETMAEMGKQQRFQDWLLIELYKSGTDLSDMADEEFSKFFNKNIYPEWKREKWSGYKKMTDFHTLVVSFGEHVLGYQKRELTQPLFQKATGKKKDQMRMVLSKKSNVFDSLVHSALYCLEKKGYIDHGPRNLFWQGEFFLTQRGEEKAYDILERGVKPDFQNINEVREIVNRYYDETLEMRRKNSIVRSLDIFYPGKACEIENAKERLSNSGLRKWIKRMEKQIEKDVFNNEVLGFIISLNDGPKPCEDEYVRHIIDEYGLAKKEEGLYDVNFGSLMMLYTMESYKRREPEEFEKYFPGSSLDNDVMEKVRIRALAS